MTTRISFLGMAGYEIVGPETRVLIDPFLTGNPLAPFTHEEIEAPDLILVTHAAYDHLGDAGAIARRTGAPVVCGADVARILIEGGLPQARVRPTVWGVAVEVGGIRVQPLECHHWSNGRLSDGTPISGVPLAFVYETEPGVRIYHYGDTSLFDMRLIGECHRPTVGLIGCTVAAELTANDGYAGRVVTGELTPEEACRVVEMLGLRIAVASHYLSMNDDVEAFVELAGRIEDVAVAAPRVGETLLVDGHAVQLEAAA